MTLYEPEAAASRFSTAGKDLICMHGHSVGVRHHKLYLNSSRCTSHTPPSLIFIFHVQHPLRTLFELEMITCIGARTDKATVYNL